MFDIPDRHRHRHAFFNGITGGGKSKLIEYLLWQKIVRGKGFTLIDPVGTTVNNLAKKIEMRKHEISPLAYWNLHYLQPGHEMTFKFDPFETTYTGKKYQNWLPVRIEHMIRAIARAYGEVDLHGQPLRERVLRNVMYFVGTNQRDGTHYGVHKGLEALDVLAPWWPAMFGRVKEYMPREVSQDWIFMKQMSRHDFGQFTQSTMNWLTRFLSPVVKSVFSGQAEAIRFKEIIETDGVALVNLEETQFFSREQGNAIAGMLVTEVIDATKENRL